MKLTDGQPRALATQMVVVPAPAPLGFSDFMALVLGAVLMAVAVIFPGRSRVGV
jgi:hypothetical protein